MVLYAISAVYFAGVMVRLMLTLTPVVCILSGIAFSKLLELFLKEDDNPLAQDNDEASDSNSMYDKVNNISALHLLIFFDITFMIFINQYNSSIVVLIHFLYLLRIIYNPLLNHSYHNHVVFCQVYFIKLCLILLGRQTP